MTEYRARASSPSIDGLLARARARLQRLEPVEAADAVMAGALLVDTRPGWQLAEHGAIPGALLVERNHLEWRLDPASDARIPQATDHDVAVVVVCQQGYASSLAAASLQDLGLHRATDLAGGFEAWAAAGLAVLPACGCVANAAATVSSPTVRAATSWASKLDSSGCTEVGSCTGETDRDRQTRAAIDRPGGGEHPPG